VPRQNSGTFDFRLGNNVTSFVRNSLILKVARQGSLSVIGYFTLATASVPRDAFPNKYVRGLPPYDLPLILLPRLAVDRRFSGKGLGHALISEAFKIALRAAGAVGCRCIITDAYRDRVDWYARSVVSQRFASCLP
jgi:GNAT superfamily N-acetyltransferase